MATAGEKIAALAVDLQAAVDAARAQSAEFADAFGRLNLALGTAVTAAELPDVVMRRLAAAYVDQHTLADYRARTEAAEKRAQDAERERDEAQREAASLRAQVESLRGEDEPVRLRPLNLEATRAERWRIHNANMEWIASLPSPSSPKTGRWKCRGCGKELLATAWTGSGSRWAQSFDAKTWIHWCENNLGSSPADRIGDAPEVTP